MGTQLGRMQNAMVAKGRNIPFATWSDRGTQGLKAVSQKEIGPRDGPWRNKRFCLTETNVTAFHSWPIVLAGYSLQIQLSDASVCQTPRMHMASIDLRKGLNTNMRKVIKAQESSFRRYFVFLRGLAGRGQTEQVSGQHSLWHGSSATEGPGGFTQIQRARPSESESPGLQFKPPPGKNARVTVLEDSTSEVSSQKAVR